jgi:minichromosome maintenance protein 10
MDDLLALMGDDQSNEVEQDPTPQKQKVSEAVSITKARISSSMPRSRAIATPCPSSSSRAEASIDAKLGIRMFKRKIGSIDLLDLVSTNPYHSPAVLVKMTTANLNQLLQDPSPVIDAATVTGRTNLLTIGIVFTNSGTKISKAGRAFSILEIGNLVTGPIVTVFLFGDVYSKVSNLCTPGAVVALLNPSIVPPNPNSNSKDNLLSLSVGDQRQLLLVAQAMDYGVCKGTSKAKRQDGRLADFPCKCHVDTRIGLYCSRHLQQGKVVGGKTAKDQSFLQKTRQEMPKQPTLADLLNPDRNIMAIPNNNTLLFQPPPKNPFLAMAPKNMVKGNVLQTKIETPPRKKPYQKTKVNALVHVTHGTATRPALPKAQPITGNWLTECTKTLSGHKRGLNRLGTSGFDGGVRVPQPHPMFRVAEPLRIHVPSGTESVQDRKNALLERQKSLSSVLQESTNHAPSLADRLKANQPKKPLPGSNAFFAELQVDVNAVLNAKSRFETEAKADEYARSRKVVSELEKSEERELQKVAKKSENHKSMAKVRREWLCVNCKRTSGIDPKMCKRLGHTVKFTRHIEETKTLTEQRLQLQDKSVDDGGITLGAGVEWTKYMHK